MPNNDHLKILREGVDAWNEWRHQNPGQIPDLSWANIANMNLKGINLEKSNLKLAFCKGCDFSYANLRQINFFGANLENASFINSDLYEANFEGALLKYSVFKNSRLTESNLKLSNLEGTLFQDSDITGAKKLKYEQLAKVKTLSNSRIDVQLLEKLKELNPLLLG